MKICNILFSVVIPVYNGQSSIFRALTSVVNQTFEKFELVIVNDGSTDDTVSIIQAFIEENAHVNIRLINNVNRGRSVARNIGVSLARGNFICFLDADDEFKPNHLESFELAIQQYPEHSVFFADSEIQRTADNWPVQSGFLDRLLARGMKNSTNTEFVEFYEDFSDGLIEGSLIPMCSTAVAREVLIKSGMFNVLFSVAEDFELWFRISLTHRFIAINKALSIVHHHECNTSSPANSYQNTIKKIEVTKFIIEKYKELPAGLQKALNKKLIIQMELLLYYASEISPAELCKVNRSLNLTSTIGYGKVLNSLIKACLKKVMRIFR